MFGTIAHAKVKPGHEADVRRLDEEWKRTIRPSIEGPVVMLRGTPKERPNETIAIFLCQDSETYGKLADAPEMDAFYQRSLEHYEGDPTWEDIQIDDFYQD